MLQSKHLLVACSALGLAVIATAIACVYSKHESRKMFVQLQSLTAQRDAMEVDWGRFQIEHSTWSAHARVERLARTQMKMRLPDPAEIRLVER